MSCSSGFEGFIEPQNELNSITWLLCVLVRHVVARIKSSASTVQAWRCYESSSWWLRVFHVPPPVQGWLWACYVSTADANCVNTEITCQKLLYNSSNPIRTKWTWQCAHSWTNSFRWQRPNYFTACLMGGIIIVMLTTTVRNISVERINYSMHWFLTLYVNVHCCLQ